MKITNKTKVKEILPLLSYKEDRILRMVEQVPEYPVYRRKLFHKKELFSILSMTVGEFIEFSKNHDKFILKLLRPNKKAYIALGQIKYVINQLKKVEKLFKNFEIKQSKLEVEAAKGINFPNTEVRMLLTLVQFFHLNSFADAEKLPVSAYFTIIWDQYSSALYQRNYQRISEQEQKKKQHNKYNGRR